MCVFVYIYRERELRNELKMIDRGERMYHNFLDLWQVPNAIIKTDYATFPTKSDTLPPKDYE